MSVFDRLDQMASNTIDTINQTPFILTPMLHTPNGRGVPDTSREVIEAKGVFDYVDAAYGIELGVRKSYREANDLRALQTGREPLLSVARKYFPLSAGEPKQGDIIEFTEKPDLPRFEVVSVLRDGMARMSIRLVHIGSQA
ncbi:hypothetical protein GA830_10580 [Mesorhizobium sp. NBSH29]|uniref:hypothetical protein n=1 Tax=Mesorhizobium sp. NBSH29 TaxID=2654249 RepID=UPI00189645EE|nr:hypothetical protein [Mesorhizobium sp. NBSH29]QPC87139.1 hypothetical protein GA830_10580 [Mesorhizobium sp. NBSH29]